MPSPPFQSYRVMSSARDRHKMRSSIEQRIKDHSLHQESFKGLRQAGVHVTEQEVKTGRQSVLSKLNMLSSMASEQFEE